MWSFFHDNGTLLRRDSVSILGIPIDNITLSEAVDCLVTFARGPDQHHVMTPNPEMLAAAQKDPMFRAVLQSSALNLPDGVGLLLAARLLGTPLRSRVTGVDAVTALCLRADVGPVFLLGAAPGVAKRAACLLREKNPALVIAGTYAGSPDSQQEEAVLQRIRTSGARLLFVAYGAPRQDMWIARNLQRMPGVKVAMGVGGAFDFLAGVRPRAPTLLRVIGLEWLWRFLVEPARFGRIFTAIVVFPFLVLQRRRS